MEILASMRRRTDGRWEAQAGLQPPIHASGPSESRCLAALRRAVKRSLPDSTGGDPVTLVVQVQPVLAGVAEAAQVMGWDKRRVITYIDRGSFPEPLQSLASGRVWLRSDVERFAAEWQARRSRRARRP
jgi:hypothetical protein